MAKAFVSCPPSFVVHTSKVLLLTVLLALTGNSLMAQSKATALDSTSIKYIKSIEDTLSILAYAIVNEPDNAQRFGACHSFIPLLTKALKTPNSFNYKFDRLRTISIQYPQDSSFRIITWQLYVDTAEYRHFGAIQMNDKELKLFPLVDRSFEITNVEQDVLPADHWYGSLYYNIRDFDTPEGRKYLMFGLDWYSFYHRRKVIDVLQFVNGKPIFGAPVFVANTPGQPPVKKRVLLEYSAESSVRCNYDEMLELIIFDHLMAVGGEIPGQGMTNIPDGTFEAYKYKKGVWEYIPKVFDTVVDEPPREFPILDHRGKNIFGRN